MTTPTTQPEFDYDVVDDSTIETTIPTYASAQWHNGQTALKQLGGVAYHGGVIITTRALPEDANIPNFTPTMLTFRTGKDEAVLAATRITLTVIRTRFCWKQGQNGHTTYLPRTGYVANAGLKGRLQVLAVLKGYSEPVAITFTGKASQCFDTLLKEFDQKVVGASNKAAPAGKHLPRFAFWLTIVAGEHQKANAEYDAIITPPLLALSDEVTRETLQKLYVGRQNLTYFTGLYHEAEAWAHAWDGAHTTLSQPDEPPEPETEIPF